MKRNEAVTLLRADKARTIAIVNGERTLTSTDRGVKFLLSLVESGDSILRGASIADKVVGRAAALIMIKGGVKDLYAEVLSVPAKDVLDKFGIQCTYGALVDGIINRNHDGPCPMESAVLGIDNPNDAVPALKAKLNQMRA